MQRSRFSTTATGARALARVASRTLTVAALCALILPAANAAEVPKKAPLTRYAELWTRSPFTTPAAVVGPAPEVNPFEDLALRGIAPLSKGFYLITLVNKKNPTETITIDTERSAEYEVVDVERDSEKALGTVVHLKKGSQTGTVSYDEKLSTLKPPPAPKGSHGNQPQIPGQPPMPPGVQTNNPAGIPQMKQRVMPPAPTTQGTPTATPQPTSGGPGSGFRPGGGPSPSGQSGSRSRNERSERPSRR